MITKSAMENGLGVQKANKKWLVVVLGVKIGFTAVAWSGPLLLFPESLFRQFGMPVPNPMVFTRLLGAAFLALLVGYALALWDLLHEKEIRDVVKPVIVGIISNGLASLLLFYFGFGGAWKGWGGAAQIAMWISAVATGLITLGLVLYGLLPASRPVAEEAMGQP